VIFLPLPENALQPRKTSDYTETSLEKIENLGKVCSAASLGQEQKTQALAGSP
jgi:hypothetical protein